MYAMLKDNGIAVRTDENIGIEFFEMVEVDRYSTFGRLTQYPTNPSRTNPTGSAHSSV